MITKKLQNLSDKLTGGHTSAHEISKQVDYIEKNYSGGGSGGGGIPEIILSNFDPNNPDNVYGVEGITAEDIRNGTIPPVAIIVTRNAPAEAVNGTFCIRTIAVPVFAVYEAITCYGNSATVFQFQLSGPDTDEIEVSVEIQYDIFNANI